MCCGSKGYRPDKGMMKDYANTINENIAPGGMDYFGGTNYFYDGKPISEEQYRLIKTGYMGYDKKKLSTSGNSQYQKDKPQFDYKPGGMGYNMMNQQNPNFVMPGQTVQSNQRTSFGNSPLAKWGDNRSRKQGYPSGQPQSMTDNSNGYVGGDYNFYNQGAAALGGQLNQATEAAKMGANTGMQMINANLGQRGIGGGGMSRMGMGNVADTMSKNMANINRDNAMGLANLQQQQQGMNFNANQARNAYNMQLANMQNQFNQQNYQNMMNQMLNQYNIDKSLRGEKYGYWKDPYNDMMNMYLQQLQAAGKDEQGWGIPLVGAVTTGIGAV